MLSIVNIDTNIGAKPEDLIIIANNFGYSGKYNEGGSIELIKQYLLRGIPVIVNWFANQGHYSVVSGLDDDNIYIMDPEFAKIRSIPINQFEYLWFGDDDILDYDSSCRKMIAVYPIG